MSTARREPTQLERERQEKQKALKQQELEFQKLQQLQVGMCERKYVLAYVRACVCLLDGSEKILVSQLQQQQREREMEEELVRVCWPETDTDARVCAHTQMRSLPPAL